MAARADDAADMRAAITSAVQKSDPESKYKGVTWNDWRNDTQLDDGWLLQTPGESVWGVNPVPAWIATGEPATCTGASCNTSVMLPSCDPSSANPCAAMGTQCLPMAATVTTVGATPQNVCMSPADHMVDVVYDAIVGAESTVDVGLFMAPDGRFQLGMRNALTYLANAKRAVTVRVLIGSFPLQELDPLGDAADGLLYGLITGQSRSQGPLAVSGGKLNVYTGRIRSGSLSVAGWNHAKVIVTDGTTVVAGGQNWFSADYLGKNPTIDLSLKAKGLVASDAGGFLNAVWKDLCTNEHWYSSRRASRHWASPSVVGGNPSITNDCLAELPVNKAVGNGNIHAMGVGRLGEIDYEGGAQSTAAIVAMLASAKQDIRIAQQDIQGLRSTWPMEFLNPIADQLIAGRDVHIVQSSDGAGGSYTGYSIGTLKNLADEMKTVLKTRKKAPKRDSDVNKLLCEHLYLAQVRFTSNQQAYPDGSPIRMHTKMVAVDDHTFYIGSQNLYPPERNMEFGIIVSDSGAFGQMKSHFWDNLWSYSKQSSISGGSPSSCYYH